MKRLAQWLVKLFILLALAGMIGHELIPHHHHSNASEEKTCCQSHKHTEDAANDKDIPCTILSSIRFENNKPDIIVSVLQIDSKKFNFPPALYVDSEAISKLTNNHKVVVYIAGFALFDLFAPNAFQLRGPPSA
jgi:hypothetical protein